MEWWMNLPIWSPICFRQTAWQAWCADPTPLVSWPCTSHFGCWLLLTAMYHPALTTTIASGGLGVCSYSIAGLRNLCIYMRGRLRNACWNKCHRWKMWLHSHLKSEMVLSAFPSLLSPECVDLAWFTSLQIKGKTVLQARLICISLSERGKRYWYYPSCITKCTHCLCCV